MKKNYYDRIHRAGRISGIIVLLLIILVPTIISVYYNIFPPLRNLGIGIMMVCAVYVPISLAEFATYTPMLGSNASYLVFVTGNLTNLKIPCALMCMENVDAKPQTEEAEVIAAIAVAVCSIVTTIIIAVGMLAMIPLQPILNAPALKPAFDHILPALFGALGAYWIQKQWKLAVVPIILTVILFLIVPSLIPIAGALIPVMGLLNVFAARIMYNKQFIKAFNEN